MREPGSAPQPLMNTVFGNGELELRFFSTITTFGTPHDVTLDELRIECMFPADDATAEFCRKVGLQPARGDRPLAARRIDEHSGTRRGVHLERHLQRQLGAKNSRCFSACSRSFGSPQLAGSSIVKACLRGR